MSLGSKLSQCYCNTVEYYIEKYIYTVNLCKMASLKKTKKWFQDQLLLNAGQKYCRMEHSAILLTFIKLPFVFKTFVLSIFEWPFYTGFTVCIYFVGRKSPQKISHYHSIIFGLMFNYS